MHHDLKTVWIAGADDLHQAQGTATEGVGTFLREPSPSAAVGHPMREALSGPADPPDGSRRAPPIAARGRAGPRPAPFTVG